MATLLNTKEKQWLITEVRNTLKSHLRLAYTPQENTPSETLQQTFGIFVTLKKNHQLRGCIGSIIGQEPLSEGVKTQAYNAGFKDPRFPELSPEEFDQLQIEISVLEPPRLIEGPQDIRLGIHGIILQKHQQSAVFLPKVPTEYHWDLNTTLSHLSQKAGLPSNGWQQNTTFYVFEADEFKETP